MARIVHISESLATGVLSALTTLINAQVADGHEVTLLGATKREDTLPTWRDDLPAKLNFIEIDMTREISPSSDFHAIKEIRSILKQIRPTVIHLHSSKAGAVGRIAALGFGATVIYQPHGLAFLRKDISTQKQNMYKGVEAVLSLLPAYIVACSKGEAAAARSTLLSKRVKVIDNAIKLSHIPRSRLSMQPITIGTCGRISPQKDPVFFAEVARLVGSAAKFIWIGDGDVEQKQLLLDTGVTVTGWCTRPEAIDNIAALTIYIQTSAWEGMPISVIEAMAAGLPVVATNIVGNKDLVEAGKTGLLASTPTEMADHILSLIKNPDNIKTLGQNAYDTAQSKYSDDAMVSKYYHVYGIS
jgi:glycosyltransferase involved in cell wall biosynthesis